MEQNKTEQTKTRPHDKFKAGNVRGVVWENQSSKRRTYLNFEFVRHTYNEKTGEHSERKSFSEADLPNLLVVVQKVNDIYRVRRENGEQGAFSKPAAPASGSRNFFCRVCGDYPVEAADDVCGVCKAKQQYAGGGSVGT